MSFKVEFGTSAEREIDEAIEWYERQLPGLGAELVSAMRIAEETLTRDPERFAVLYVSRSGRRVHRLLLRRFPYSMHYLIDEQFVRVIAFMQANRDPRRWERGA